MDINVFLLCFNEAPLLPHTIKHYKKFLPSCKITIYDNESTDNSVNIAKELGCTVVSWSSNNIHDEDLQISLRNSIWKTCKNGWIIMADMDEFVCVTEDELKQEMNSGVTILSIKGYDMIGDSETLDLTDIDLQKITKYIDNPHEYKNLCFLRDNISDMNYGPGSHFCNPTGKISHSSKVYINKHMSCLGLPFLKNKLVERYKRNEKMRTKGWNIHYTQDLEEIEKMYTTNITNCKIIN
jgi:glycosyltransferase involved in cell wall biosynthesis